MGENIVNQFRATLPHCLHAIQGFSFFTRWADQETLLGSRPELAAPFVESLNANMNAKSMKMKQDLKKQAATHLPVFHFDRPVRTPSLLVQHIGSYVIVSEICIPQRWN